MLLEVTQNTLREIQNKLKLDNNKFFYADGKIMFKTSSKEKIELLKELTGKTEVKKEKLGWKSIKIQEKLNLEELIEKYSPYNVFFNGNKNILYVYGGENVTEEFAKSLAEKTGGEYTTQNNPYLKKGYHRINYYKEVGLCLFTEFEMKQFEQLKRSVINER